MIANLWKNQLDELMLFVGDGLRNGHADAIETIEMYISEGEHYHALEMICEDILAFNLPVPRKVYNIFVELWNQSIDPEVYDYIVINRQYLDLLEPLVVEDGSAKVKINEPPAIPGDVKQELGGDSVSRKLAQGEVPKLKWDRKAFAEEMKHSLDPVSAFFLIDSVGAIAKCAQWLSILRRYKISITKDFRFFKDVAEIYASGREVVNYDYNFTILWQDRVCPAILRCHYFQKGQYEIELWIPGVVANEIADEFKDGHEGFCCAYMPPAFYD